MTDKNCLSFFTGKNYPDVLIKYSFLTYSIHFEKILQHVFPGQIMKYALKWPTVYPFEYLTDQTYFNFTYLQSGTGGETQMVTLPLSMASAITASNQSVLANHQLQSVIGQVTDVSHFI